MWQVLMVDGVEVAQVARVVTIAWPLWHNKNELRNGGEKKSGQALVQRAMDHLTEYEAAGDCFKVNVDGTTFFSKQKATGLGVVIRDDKGRVEAALCRRIDVPLGAVEAEAKAWEAGLLFAKDVSVHEVVLEGDSLVVYNALCGTSPPPSSVASIVLGMQDLCKEFRKIDVFHIRRQGNKPAHLLAKHASMTILLRLKRIFAVLRKLLSKIITFIELKF